jgi:iron complex transport system substrate-binding protein
MTKNTFVFVSFFAGFFFCVNALAQSPDYPRTVIDGAGRELVLESRPERLVTYYNDSFGMLATLGVMPVAQSVNPEMLVDPIYFGEAGADLTTIPYTDSPDLEAVVAAKPDLVFVYSEEEVQALEGLAPAFVTPAPATLEELYDAVRLYGRVLGREAEAEAAVTAFQNRLNAYAKANIANADTTILKLASYEGQFSVATTGDPVCQMLEVVARCPWQPASLDEGWGYDTSIEGVLELDPDILIFNNWTDKSDEEMFAEVAANPLWNELAAVQNEKVFSTPGYDNPIASSLPAAQKVLDTYMPKMFPEIFPEALTDEQVQEILAKNREQ